MRTSALMEVMESRKKNKEKTDGKKGGKEGSNKGSIHMWFAVDAQSSQDGGIEANWGLKGKQAPSMVVCMKDGRKGRRKEMICLLFVFNGSTATTSNIANRQQTNNKQETTSSGT
jgi:hypothetical protein